MLARFTGAPAAPSGNVITLNGASFRPDQELAPGSFFTTFGTFSATPDQILIGSAYQAPSSTAPTQVNFVIPSSAAPGLTTISVLAAGHQLATGQATITTAGPGIFVLDNTNPAQPGAVENQDYSVNSQQNPARPGSTISIYATGYGPLDSTGQAPVAVYFGDTPAKVLYSAPVPGATALWQIQCASAIRPQPRSPFSNRRKRSQQRRKQCP